MSLSDFIESNLPELVDEWAEYASTISLKDSHLTETQLRNSARDILTRIAADMREPQTAEQQQAKSRGNEHDPASGFDRVAHEHADDRLAQGYGSTRWWRNIVPCAPVCCGNGSRRRRTPQRFLRRWSGSMRQSTICSRNRSGTTRNARSASGICLPACWRTICVPPWRDIEFGGGRSA